MKICPKCSQTYGDDSLNYCLSDGSILEQMSGAGLDDSAKTAVMDSALFSAAPTLPMGVYPTQIAGGTAPPAYSPMQPPAKSRSWLWVLVILGGLVLVCGGGIVGLVAVTWQQGELDSNYGVRNNSGPQYDLTQEKYDRIYNGMTRSAVEDLLGGPGTEFSRDIGAGVTYTNYRWEGKNNVVIFITFRDDKVNGTSESGLTSSASTRPSSPSPSTSSHGPTMEKYNQLSIGMARSEVERILGGKGTEISSSTGGGMGFSVNKWEGDNFKSIILSFRNDKVMTKSQVGLK